MIPPSLWIAFCKAVGGPGVRVTWGTKWGGQYRDCRSLHVAVKCISWCNNPVLTIVTECGWAWWLGPVTPHMGGRRQRIVSLRTAWATESKNLKKNSDSTW
jgi:hypothetical protein